jgi:peptidoglycan/xylan/chitin deacetylase (PgdA/CDA1 family)
MARVPASVIDASSRRSRRLSVLAYHAVDDLSRFTQQVEYLCEHMQPISLEDVLRARDESDLPSRPVLVTFDDGDPSVMDAAAVLAERGLSAVAFVVPGVLDSERPYWWVEADALVRAAGRATGTATEAIRRMKALPDDERLAQLDQLRAGVPGAVRQRQLRRADLLSLEAGGIEIGNHTFTHRYLSRCPEEIVAFEIEEAHRTLEDVLGHPPRAFAYPDRDRDPRAVPILRDLGYRAAFLFDHRLARLPLADPLSISRVRVSSTTSFDRFRANVSGVHPALHGLRSRITGREA